MYLFTFPYITISLLYPHCIPLYFDNIPPRYSHASHEALCCHRRAWTAGVVMPIQGNPA